VTATGRSTHISHVIILATLLWRKRHRVPCSVGRQHAVPIHPLSVEEGAPDAVLAHPRQRPAAVRRSAFAQAEPDVATRLASAFVHGSIAERAS
jgi:hypothetical protein